MSTSPSEIYTLSLHDALPICHLGAGLADLDQLVRPFELRARADRLHGVFAGRQDRFVRTRRAKMRAPDPRPQHQRQRSEEHTSELQSRPHLVCRLLLEKKKPT